MPLRPLHDFMVVELEPVKEFTRGRIIKVAPEPIRVGRVVAIGPGRHYMDRFVPTTLKPGARVVFFQAVTETKQGKQLHYAMPDNQELLRETDALFEISDGADVEVTR